jgi:hypothetical protein
MTEKQPLIKFDFKDRPGCEVPIRQNTRTGTTGA